MKLTGAVIKGRGVAKERLKQDEEISFKISSEIFPGSLNLVMSRPLVLLTDQSIKTTRRFLVKGAVQGRTVWLVRWNSCPLHVVEVISEHNLRRCLGLEEGQDISVEVTGDPFLRPRAISLIVWTIFWNGRGQLYYRSDWYVKFVRWFFFAPLAEQAQKIREPFIVRLIRRFL